MRHRLFSRIGKLLSSRSRRRKKHDSTEKAGDWERLSPESPPLPPLQVPDLPSKRDPCSKRPSLSTAVRDSQPRRLYTIPEEAETTATTATPSGSRLRAAEQQCIIDTVSTNDTNGSIPSSPSSSSSSSSLSISSSACSSSQSRPDAPYRLPVEWTNLQAMSGENGDNLQDNTAWDEPRCQARMSQMVQHAYRLHRRNSRDTGFATGAPHTELRYDHRGNVSGVRVLSASGTNEYWRFHGNSQYIPPEVAIQGIYQPQLVQVWIMGVWLYRMLVGKLPFAASDDTKLFVKMSRSDFYIPCHLSEDAKDLLRRMLSPHQSRASLDLVMFHPWLKACSSHDTRRPSTNSASSQQHRSSRHLQLPPPPPPPPPRSSARQPNKVAKAVKFLTHGPYPPPRRPYRELALLGHHQPHAATVI